MRCLGAFMVGRERFGNVSSRRWIRVNRLSLALRGITTAARNTARQENGREHSRAMTGGSGARWPTLPPLPGTGASASNYEARSSRRRPNADGRARSVPRPAHDPEGTTLKQGDPSIAEI
jgi:hypothetical protein